MAKDRRKRQDTEKPWDYTTGEKGLNRVRVYERRPGGPLQVLWYVRGQAVRESLRNLNGTPIFDRDLAMDIADRMAKARRREVEGKQARDIMGIAPPHSLGELLDELHNTRDPDWSAKYKQQQETIRDWWKAALKVGTLLTDINEAAVKQAFQRRAKRGWSQRTRQKYLRYLKDAYNFGHEELKWLTKEQTLTALKMPVPDSQGLPYSEDEMYGILEVAPEKDLRMAAAAHVVHSTLARISAVRQLGVEAYTVEKIRNQITGEVRERGVITFPGAIEKPGTTGRAVLTDTARRYVEMLLQTPLVQSSGLLFPRGDLDTPDTGAVVMSEKTISDWLKWCEAKAGVERIRGRGWHSFKRRLAQVAGDEVGIRRASKQARTTEQTMQRHYDQESPEAQAAVADALEARWKKRAV